MKGPINWDAYRAAYPRMTYAQVAAFHRQVWRHFPDQRHCSPEHLDRFFETVPAGARVVEVGGWRGEMAARILANRPDLASWLNLEICQDAVTRPVTTDPRYRGVFPPTWAWDTPLECHDVAVLAHLIEHISWRQLRSLVAWLAMAEARQVYIESPLADGPRSWRHSTTAHLLEVGWDSVTALLAANGYAVRERFDYAPGRTVLFVGR